jgi:hypothetical protein
MIDGEGKMYIAGSYHPAVEIIPDVLATWGAGDEGWDYMLDRYNLIQWKELEVGGEKWPVVDCRDIIDGPGNPLWMYQKKIQAAYDRIQWHGKVIICCLAGISRSNSIALGTLIKLKNMDYIEAYGEIKDKVPYADMDQAHLNAIKKLYPPRIPFSDAKVRKNI